MTQVNQSLKFGSYLIRSKVCQSCRQFVLFTTHFNQQFIGCSIVIVFIVHNGKHFQAVIEYIAKVSRRITVSTLAFPVRNLDETPRTKHFSSDMNNEFQNLPIYRHLPTLADMLC
jgi:hypothetical protein